MRVSFERTAGCRWPAGALDAVATAARRLAPRDLWVQVVGADDTLLRQLNRDFRRQDRATDVLSFRYARAASGRGSGPDAEVYVSLERAARQARECGRTLRQEFVLLVVHGLLHVQGHDHHARADRRRMHAAESDLLRRLAPRRPWLSLPPMVAPAPAPSRRKRP
jgi:probable rRNA maturation factor